MELVKELWEFLRIRKKLWLAPIIMVMLILGGLINTCARICCSTIHLYTFLESKNVYTWDICLLS